MALLVGTNESKTKVCFGGNNVYSILFKDEEIYPTRKKTLSEMMNAALDTDDVPYTPMDPTAME